MDNQNQDLQTYFDSFNRDIDEVTLEPEEADVEANVSGAEGEQDAYYSDQDDCFFEYFEPSKTENTTVGYLKKGKSGHSEETGDDNKVEFVLIVDECQQKEEHLRIKSDANEEVYEFDETEEDRGEAVDDKDLLVPTQKVVQVKASNNSSGISRKVFRCTMCPYTTHKRFILSRHMKGHSDDRPFKCSVCERGFKTNASLTNHVNVHLGNKPFPCDSCDMRFTTSGELSRHVRYRHTHEKPHKCTECDYASVEMTKLRRHMRCHTGERPYQCPHCTYASPDTFKLKRHMRTHTGEKPYECDICHACFTQSNSLKAHRLIHSVGDKPVFQCSLCPTTCGRKTDLRLHVQKLHHSDKPIICKRCGKDLPDRYSYKIHVKTHDGEKCYRCKLCPYKSISMRHLDSHMLIHTNEKPFVCETCKMSFRQRQLLVRHINLCHNPNYVPPIPGEKIHACPHCSRRFRRKGNLMRHMEMHDPDSRLEKQKLNLKIGRNTRLLPDGRVEKVDNDELSGYNTIECVKIEDDDEAFDSTDDENYEIIETLDEDESDGKHIQNENDTVEIYVENPSTSRLCNFTRNSLKTKKEQDKKEVMTVKVNDNGESYMIIEVLHSSDDDENGEEKVVEVGKKILNKSQRKKEVKNFQFCKDEEEYSDNKESIQLMDVINEV